MTKKIVAQTFCGTVLCSFLNMEEANEFMTDPLNAICEITEIEVNDGPPSGDAEFEQEVRDLEALYRGEKNDG